MSNLELVALKAKVRVANHYLEEVIKHRGKFDLYDVFKVVTIAMRPFVETVSIEQAREDGLGYVRIKEGV